MKFFSSFILLFLVSASCFSQLNLDYYLISFTDKNGSPYSTSDPEVFLSQQAIARRTKFTIPVSSLDFPVNPQYIDSVKNIGVKIVQETKWLNAIVIKTSDTSKLHRISLLPFVKKVVKNRNLLGQTLEPVTPASPDRVPDHSGASSDYGQAFSQISMVGGIPLHDLGFRGQGLSIAVLDGGFTGANFMKAFDSLRLNGQIKGTLNLVGGGTYVYQGTSHGSNVLSVLAANIPGVMVGTAPKANYYLIRSEDTNGESLLEEYNWVTGAEYADSAGADIISTSLSYVLSSDPATLLTFDQLDGKTAPITIAAEIATSRGMIVVASAGNNGENQSWPHVGFPADGDSVFAIGAVDAHGQRAYFSSPGPTFDGRLKPDVMAMGVGTAVMLPDNTVGTGDGTSFATPIIAGLTACLWQANPGKSNMEILSAIRISSSGFTNPDSLMGDGIPDFFFALSLLGVNDLQGEPDKVTVSPNPFSGSVKICLSDPSVSSIDIELTGPDGKTIYKKYGIPSLGGTCFRSNLSFLSKGFYLLKITGGTKTWFKSIIKQ
jgi:serine protease AprX